MERFGSVKGILSLLTPSELCAPAECFQGRVGAHCPKGKPRYVREIVNRSKMADRFAVLSRLHASRECAPTATEPGADLWSDPTFYTRFKRSIESPTRDLKKIRCQRLPPTCRQSIAARMPAKRRARMRAAFSLFWRLLGSP